MDNTDGVKALLDKLKSSQAWQQTIAVSPDPPPPATAPPETPGDSSTDVRPSVASLLAQLADTRAGHPSLPLPNLGEPRLSETVTPGGSSGVAPSRASIDKGRDDLHAFSFQQTLSHLADLSAKPGFVDSIRRIQDEQSALESQLWGERLAIRKKHQEKVKVAVTKANLIGSGGLSQFEADMLAQAYKKELHKFDTQRATAAWDGLISKQQAALESLGVPVMYVSDLTADKEKQLRIVRVLESIVNGADV